MTTLPEIIPIFPLPNVVLFPGVHLPLHIFEPRYRDMVRDCAKGEERLIGMVLLRGDWRKEYYACPDIFPVGCAGRVMNVQTLPDGRYNILLHGVREFVVDEELRERSYRRARVRWRPPAAGALGADGRARLDDLLRRYVQRGKPAAVQMPRVDDGMPDELRVNFLCYALEIGPLEKQALLEAMALAERAERLCQTLEFAVGAGVGQPPQNEQYH